MSAGFTRRAWLRASAAVSVAWCKGQQGASGLNGIPIARFNEPWGTVSRVIERLRREYGAAISLIQAVPEATFEVEMRSTTALGVLTEAISHDAAYRLWEVRNRCIAAPLVWTALDERISGVRIAGIPRLEAARNYLDLLRRRGGIFAQVTGPVLKGDPRAALYADPVTLTGSATVMEHFGELLGNDDRAVFSIWLAHDDIYTFGLETVTAAH